MTITMQDVETARTHEAPITRVVVPARSKWRTAAHWVDVGVAVVLWGAVLMAASGLGLLLEAIVDTLRYGAPR